MSAGLTRIPSAGSVTSWGLENVASLATEIQQGFPLILLLVSPRLWKGATGSSYRRIPWSPVDPGRAQGGGGRGVSSFGDGFRGVCTTTNLTGLLLQSCSLFKVERRCRQRTRRMNPGQRGGGGVQVLPLF